MPSPFSQLPSQQRDAHAHPLSKSTESKLMATRIVDTRPPPHTPPHRTPRRIFNHRRCYFPLHFNYLLHMREIKASSGSYYHNSKAKLDQVSIDVKAFDASRVSIKSSVVDEEVLLRKSLYSVSERAIRVRIQKVVDPDVAALLDEMDSRFADADELEEDFVVQANFPNEVETAVDDVDDEALTGREEPRHDEVRMRSGSIDQEIELRSGGDGWATEKPRVRCLLDEQFDLVNSAGFVWSRGFAELCEP